MAVIKVEQLVKSYGSGLFNQRRVDAVRGVSLEVGAGEIFGILGANGAGKTTIVKMLVGLLRPSGGYAEVLGRPVGERAIRARIGYLPEHHRFPEYLTGMEALEYYGSLTGLSRREVQARAPAVLEQVGMGNWAHTKLRQYSKGMGQRLGLAQAMVHDPDVYFLDEPTDGIDPVGRTEIRGILRGLRDRGKTVFLNSHLLQEVELICDRVAILARGEVLKLGTVREITTRKPQLRMVVDRALGDLRPQLLELVGPDLGEEAPASEGDGIAFSVPADDAARIDRLVDLLRGSGRSIRAMERVRLSLEDAFIEAVGERQVGGAVAEVPSAPRMVAKVAKIKYVGPGQAPGQG